MGRGEVELDSKNVGCGAALESRRRPTPDAGWLRLACFGEAYNDGRPDQGLTVRSPRVRSGRRALPPASSRLEQSAALGCNGARQERRRWWYGADIRPTAEKADRAMVLSKPVAEHGYQLGGLVSGGGLPANPD